MVDDDRTPPWKYEDRHRRLANAARRAIKKAGILSVDELKKRPRPELMRVLPPTAYDVVNDALNRGEEAKLREILESE